MSLVLNVEILGEFKNLTAATKGAQSQLTSMNKRAQTVSKAITGAFAAIGVGFSLRVITRELEEAAKAAVEDSKSMNLLALAMKNTAGATKEQIAQAEKSINKMQFQAGVADDELRPAFQKLFIATKDVTASNRLLQIALDASAATGKSLDAVSMAMAKSLAGSDTALLRLIPSLKGAIDPMAELERTFAGAAAEAANTDPYQRMQIIFGEMQEQIGMALLPVLNQLSAWLATPEGQEKLQGLIDLVVALIGNFTTLLGYVIDNKEAFLIMAGVVGTVTVGLKLYTLAANLGAGATTALGLAAKTALPALTAIIAALELIKWLQENLKFDAPTIQGSGGKSGPLNFSGQSGADYTPGGSNMDFITPKKTVKTPTVVNLNVKTVNDAKTTINEVKRFQNSTGVSLGRALQG
jgi:hypothetical protein